MTVSTPTAVPAPRAGADAARDPDAMPAPAPTPRVLSPWAARVPMVALLGWWGWFAVHGTGGRDAGAVVPMAALAALAAAVEVVMARLAGRALMWLAAGTLTPLAVCVFAPTGWSGAQQAISYVAAATSAVAALSFARRDAAGPELLVGGFLVAGLLQLASALTPWWGHGDPAAAMVGTFYWHDAFAAWMLAPAVLGFAIVADPRDWNRFLRPLAWCAAVLCPIGVVLSTSRAAMACLAAAVVVTVVPLVLRSGRAALVRVVGAAGGSSAVLFLLTGPPFFDHRSQVFAGTSARAATGETLSQNSAYRVQFWHEALSLWHRFPWAGGGFGSLADGSVGHTPTGWALTPYAHQGYLQVLSDGGLLLAVPFAVGLAVVAARLLRTGWGARPSGSSTSAQIAIGGALCALLAHSLVDLDTSFPVLLVGIALLAGVLVATTGEARTAPRHAAFAAAAIAVAATGFGAWAVLQVRHDAALLRRPATTQAERTADLRAALTGPLADPEAARSVLLGAVTRVPAAPLAVDPGIARLAVAHAGRLTDLDARALVARARVQVRLGDRAAAQAVLDRVTGSGLVRSAGLDLDVALLADDLGQTDQARGIAGSGLLSALGDSPASAAYLAGELTQLGGVGAACQADLTGLAAGTSMTVTPVCRALLSSAALEVRR